MNNLIAKSGTKSYLEKQSVSYIFNQIIFDFTINSSVILREILLILLA